LTGAGVKRGEDVLPPVVIMGEPTRTGVCELDPPPLGVVVLARGLIVGEL
jgi:hypothetical protein